MTPLERAGFLAHARLPVFARRVEKAREAISEALRQAHRPYIAFSTGKDSTAMAALVWEQRPDAPAVYIDADCAFPESAAFLDRTEAAGRTVIRWPCEPFLETLKRVGGPDAPGCEAETMRATVYRPIQALKAQCRFDAVFVGLRAQESAGRRMNAKARGLLYPARYDGLLHCTPVALWHYQDIWAYIVSAGLDYNREYDAMEEMPLHERRISYWAGETSRNMGRIAWLRRRHPELYRRYVALFPEVASYT